MPCRVRKTVPDTFFVWKRHLINTGRNREETIEILKRLLGENWRAASQEDAEQAMDESQQKHD